MSVTTVQVGDREVRLRLPESFALRYDIVGAAVHSQARAYAAALGVCWSGGGKPKARLDLHHFSPASYGGAVLDELVEAGVRPGQAIAAGAVAWGLIADSVFPADEVDEAEDFSDPPEGDSTS